MRTCHIFCRVIDNFGDAGVSWRLAINLVRCLNWAVVLWIDDVECLERMVPLQTEVEIRYWDNGALSSGLEIPNVVIEAFGCQLPDLYIKALSAGKKPPVWLNLEYLSAENWVEGSHLLPSLHPNFPLTKFFFFPGFSEKTGGLLCEPNLIEKRLAFQQDEFAKMRYLRSLVGEDMNALTVSLFCYPNAPVNNLFHFFSQSEKPVLCLVPEGVATEKIKMFFGEAIAVGGKKTVGQLTVNVIPFLTQEKYDYLLWSCDINFVRGEDSFVRAQWAGKPFVWHIYPQDEKAHITKLLAFLEKYEKTLPLERAQMVKAMWLMWNGEDVQISWSSFFELLPQLTLLQAEWVVKLQRCGDLISNIDEFVKKIG